ncbi:DUF4148 domain-containing protein [Herbaspirillum aquaticum]|jgi:hypothetical protein|nr:DUF4148 domain-containing protein [Herbaspirillum aquaticum]
MSAQLLFLDCGGLLNPDLENLMKSTAIFALLATLLTASIVNAQSMTPEQRDNANVTARNNYPIVPFQSKMTRADVLAELKQAQSDGVITNGNNYPIIRQASTPKSRAEVKKELESATSNDFRQSLYHGA